MTAPGARPTDYDDQALALRLSAWLAWVALDHPELLPLMRSGTDTSSSRLWVNAVRSDRRASLAVFQRADEMGHGEICRGVARLFAVYHRGSQLRDPARIYGQGSMGDALGRLATKDPRRGELRLAALMRPRSQLPWGCLETVCADLRETRTVAPNWGNLALDLSRWYRPRDRSAMRVPTVAERWFGNYNHHVRTLR